MSAIQAAHRTVSHMARTLVLGRPGAYSSKLARAALMRVAGLYAAVLAVTAVALVTDIHIVFGAVGAAAAVVLAQPERVNYRKASVGARSERRVASVLRKRGYVAVVHGALLGAGGDADHVVLGPHVALVETKTGRGRVNATPNSVTVGGRTLPGNPVAQARRQAKAVSRFTKQNCTPVLCIVDGTTKTFTCSGVIVTNLTNLPDVLGKVPTSHMTDKAAKALARKLAASGS